MKIFDKIIIKSPIDSYLSRITETSSDIIEKVQVKKTEVALVPSNIRTNKLTSKIFIDDKMEYLASTDIEKYHDILKNQMISNIALKLEENLIIERVVDINGNCYFVANFIVEDLNKLESNKLRITY